MLIRQSAPVIGADGSTYTPAGEWQFSVGARNLRSTDHYNGTVEQLQRQTQGTYVVNMQHSLDFTVGYQINQRLSVSGSVPYFSGSWSIPAPRAPVLGPRAQEDALGIGDIVVAARSWVLNPKSHRSGNVSIGLGVKMPTGKPDVQDQFVDINGQNNTSRYVDQSVQPGDGGWGITTELTAFKRMGRVMTFGSFNYLINPRDTNNTPSIIVNLGIPVTPPNANRVVNSVPDQYVARLGASAAIGKGFGASLAWRIEGMPRYDLIGRSDGWRRPGKEMFIEPGISYSRGSSSFGFQVPIGYYRNREPDPYTGQLGDATFPRFIILGNYSLRFGKASSQIGIPRGPIATATESALGTPAAAPLPAPSVLPGQQVVRLTISGMTCDQCVETVHSALVKAKGVVSADVSLAGHEAVVVYEPAKTTVKNLLKAVKNAKGMNPYAAEVQP